jgi:hypothetical protein
LANTAIDLYTDDFSRLTDTDVFHAIEAFTRTSEPTTARPRESFVLDFKRDWGDRALRTVAGFAHTFGGLLIVGVSEKDGQPDQLVGVDSPGELKTSIASSIATNISPSPPYQIAECSLPTTPNRKLAVVRVRQGDQIYYCTKKGEHPIYVRNEDESVPADAARLRSLIEAKGAARTLSEATQHRISTLQSVGLVHYDRLPPSTVPQHVRIILSPFEHPGLILDSTIEQNFRKLVHQNFAFRYRNTEYEREEERWIDWYEWRWFRAADKLESVWRLTSSGDLAYARQVRIQGAEGENPAWSLGDIVADILLLMAVGRSLWRASGSYGEAQLVVSILVYELALSTDLVTDAWSASSPTASNAIHDFNAALRDSIVLNPQPSSSAGATSVFNSALPLDAITGTVANVINQLLRCLKHAADVNALRRAVENFIRAAQ